MCVFPVLKKSGVVLKPKQGKLPPSLFEEKFIKTKKLFGRSRTHETGSLKSCKMSSKPKRHRSTSKKNKHFISEPMSGKSVGELAGIGETLSKRLKLKGYTLADQLLAKYLHFRKDEVRFREWLARECGANKKQTGDCYRCLNEWCSSYL